MNSEISNLFNDIFSNIYSLQECTDGDCLSCVMGSRCIIVRLIRFYNGFLNTSEGKGFEKWKAKTKDLSNYSVDQFISEYKQWFSFYCYTQYEGTMNGQGIYDRRLLLFEPLFLTLPFIYYIKNELNLNYFYIYFINFNEPDVYSIFRIQELDDFKCYFPWYSGFRFEACPGKNSHGFLIDSLNESNRHLARYIINVFEYKSQFKIDKINGKPFSKKTDNIIKYISTSDIKTLREFEELNFQNVESFLKILTAELQNMELNCDLRRIGEKYFENIDTHYDERRLQEARLLLTNFCLQDIFDDCLEAFRELGLPKAGRSISRDFFHKIICRNSYAWRERDYESWNHYLLSLRIDLFSIYILFKDYVHFYRSDLLIKELVDKLISYQFFRDFINSLKEKMEESFDFDEFLLQLNKRNLNDVTVRNEIEQKYSNYKEVFEDVLKYECRLLQDFFSPYTFRNKLGNDFDYGFVALHLSDLRYRLISNVKDIELSDVIYEIHCILNYIPLPPEAESDVKTRRLNKAKNFFCSFISPFTTKIVSMKMANITHTKRLEIENKKERTVAHLLKSLQAKIISHMNAPHQKYRDIAKVISRYLSLYFTMRQIYTFEPIDEKESLYIDFISLLEFLLIEDFVIFDGGFPRYERYPEILERISNYLKLFLKPAGGLEKNNFLNTTFFPTALKNDFFENTRCLKLKYINDRNLEIFVNTSKLKKKFFPLLGTFTELIRNARKYRKGSNYLNLIIYPDRDCHHLIFSKQTLTAEMARSYVERSQSWQEYEESKRNDGFGLDSIDYYLSHHNCKLRVLKEAENFFTIIAVFPSSNLFCIKTKREVGSDNNEA